MVFAGALVPAVMQLVHPLTVLQHHLVSRAERRMDPYRHSTNSLSIKVMPKLVVHLIALEAQVLNLHPAVWCRMPHVRQCHMCVSSCNGSRRERADAEGAKGGATARQHATHQHTREERTDMPRPTRATDMQGEKGCRQSMRHCTRQANCSR